LTHRPAWIELDNTLTRQLEISVLLHFPIWVPRVVEGGLGRTRYPDYWQPELAKIHRKAQLLEAYVTPDEHSIALGAFGEAFGCIGLKSLLDGWDTDFLELSEPQSSPHSFPLPQQSQSPVGSISSFVEDLDSDAEASPPNRISSFKTSLTSLPSGFVPTPCDKSVFGSPEVNDGYGGLTRSCYLPAHTRSSESTLGLCGVSGFRKPIYSTESGWLREDPILISDLPVQSELPGVFFGSPPPYPFTSRPSSRAWRDTPQTRL
jgi:hypothetical protein